MKAWGLFLPLEGGGDSPKASGWGWSPLANALPVATTTTRAACQASLASPLQGEEAK